MQMKLRNLFVVLTLVLVSSCEEHKPPKGELCASTGLQCGELKCNNPNLPNDIQDYTRHINRGDIAVNPSRFKDMQLYCVDLREKLIKCENKK